MLRASDQLLMASAKRTVSRFFICIEMVTRPWNPAKEFHDPLKQPFAAVRIDSGGAYVMSARLETQNNTWNV
jgi:hypothetical protein